MYLNHSIESIKEMLQDKIKLFFRYEEITDKMFEVSSEKLLELVDERQELASKIDSLNQSLVVVYEQDNKDQLIRQAVLNQLAWGDCPNELKVLFSLGQELASIISRILRKEQQVQSNVESQKEVILNLIRQQNSGVSANAEKYYRTSKLFEENLSLFHGKY